MLEFITNLCDLKTTVAKKFHPQKENNIVKTSI